MKKKLLAAVLLLSSIAGWYASDDPVRPEPLAGNTRTVDAVDGGGGVFQMLVPASPETIARAFLVYELDGVPHWTAALRSINGLPVSGGFGAVHFPGNTGQIEEINPRWLRRGLNHIAFFPAPGARPDDAIPYTVTHLRLVYLLGASEPAPSLVVTHPVQKDDGATGMLLRGFVDPAGQPDAPAELFIDRVYLPQGIRQADGSFSAFVPRTTPAGEAWDVELEVVYRDGTRIRRTVRIADEQSGEPESEDGEAGLEAGPDTDASFGLEEARLDVGPGALSGKVKLTMRGLRAEELPAMDAGMTNVTPRRRGFRLGPHGLRFRKPVQLRLPYDPALIPKGMSEDDIRTFYFDEEAGRWMPVALIEVERGKAVVSATDHFTDFVNATLAMPEESEGTNFEPNALEEPATANPAAGIVQIAPPEGDATGDASLDFPLEIPPGRQGMQPELAVRYNSGAGNGWLGVGWHLELPSIAVSTLFGAPRYDGSEAYVIDGEQLVRGSAANLYVRRVEGSFERIERKESNPRNYWWEVTDKDGTRSIYGAGKGRLRDPQSGNIFRWYLERQIDVHGNTVTYSYVTDEGSDGEPWTFVYPERIDYTSGPNLPAYYSVRFILDSGRHDRISSGIEGFKTWVRRRLARVEVRAGNDLVRQYVFAYREGDFRKSLLASIDVSGEGGAHFYRHTFDYNSMPLHEEEDGYAAFGEEETWGGMGAGSDLTASERTGGGGHGFAGLGPVGCQPHAGVQAGGSGTDSTTSVVFVDVNGDGLPDRLDSQGRVDRNAFDPLRPATGGFSSGRVDALGPLGHTSEWTLDVGVGAHAEAGLPASADLSWVWSHANDDRLFSDVDGDLRPDLVSTGGDLSVRLNTGSSFDDAVKWDGFDSGGLDLSSDGEEEEVLSRFRRADALRQLVLPYAGKVTLTGAIAKQAQGGDGVDAAIYHNSTPVWSHRFEKNETAPCSPGPANSCNGGLTLPVMAGDSLYFLAGSIRDTNADALQWAPVVSYDGQDLHARAPDGSPVFVFDAARDFSLAGYDGVSWGAVAGGTVRVTGTLVKLETSDHVTLTVSRDRGKGDSTTLFSRVFAASEVTSFNAIPPVEVEAGDRLYLTLKSSTPVGPGQIRWTPSVRYEGASNPPVADSLREAPAVVAMPVPQFTGQPWRAWTASATGQQSVSVKCTAATAGQLYLQGVNRLLATAPMSGTQTVSLSGLANAGEPLFVTLITGASAISCSANSNGSVPLNVRRPALGWSSVLSGGHHGWYYGEWNGDRAFHPAALVPPKDDEDERDYVAAAPHWEVTEQSASPSWTAAGFDLYLNGEGLKPSRTGANAAGVLDQASGAGDAGGLSVLRKSSGRTEGFGFSAIAGFSLSRGSNETQVDLVDMNGDRYPDQVSSSGVRFSNGKNGFGKLEPFPGIGSAVRESRDVNAALSVGTGITYTKKNGKGQSKSVTSTTPSVGSTVSLTHTRHDLIDVNGDGLPDRVSMSPGSGEVSVRLNLGYRFGAPETWTLPEVKSSRNFCSDVVDFVTSGVADLTDLDTLNGLSFTRSSAASLGAAYGPFGATVSTTLSRTLVELADINGDGLPDRVIKDQQEQDRGYFRVQLNLGDRWDEEQRWYVPDWDAQIGHGYNPGSSFQCLDAVSFSGNIELQVSAGVPVCITLVPLVPVAGLQLEVSGQVFTSLGNGMQLFLEDLDGDGLADHVLKKSGDGNVYVKRNQAGGVNLLRTVHRPLGSRIDLAYERRGNHAEMPFHQWVLSRVTVSDGASATYVTKYSYPNDAVFDRAERESYGYGSVTITLPDQSTVEREFLNDSLHTRHLTVKETLRDAKGNLFRVETAAYETFPVDGSAAARFTALTAAATSFYEGTTTPKTTGSTYVYDRRGNVVETTGSGDEGKDDDVTARIAYRTFAGTPLTRAEAIDVSDGRGRLLRSRRGTFDEHGQLTVLEQTLTGGRDPASGFAYSGKSVATKFAYDAFGNIASSTSPSGSTSTFTYDPKTATHPVEVRDSFGHVTRYAYDLKYGELTSTVDENGNVMRRAYDHFGRLSRIVGPYDTDDAPALAFEYDHRAPMPWAVVRHKDATRPGTIDSAVFIDSLERVVQTKEDAELDGGTGTSTRTGMRVSGRVTFDVMGRVSAEGQPFFKEGSAPNVFVSEPAKRPASYAYDVLGRMCSVTLPDGAVTRLDYGFDALDGVRRFVTVRTDPALRVTRFYHDVAGRVLGVEQHNTIRGARKKLITRYAYDALEQLTEVTDAKGNRTRLEYDTLGRNVVLDNPDLGRTELRYDPAGNLGARITASLAARNQQIRYHYTFDRLDRIDYPQSPDVVYTWGAPGAPLNRANRIVTVADASGLEERSYGKLGEVVQTVKTTSALKGTTPKGPYTTRFAYDGFQRLLSVVYPDGETLTYGYDAGGKVQSASGVLKGVRFDYLRHRGYDEHGEQARVVLGNGVETRFTYDPSSRFLTELRTTAAGRELQKLRYQYDRSGTLLAMQNDVPVPAAALYGGPVSQTFQYDDLAQLTAAQGTYRGAPNKTSTYTLALAYDELGNTVSKRQLHQSGSGKLNVEKKTSYDWTYSYAGPRPHAPTSIGERTFQYDPSGNQTGWESSANGTRRTLVWDEENRLAAVSDNGQTTRFLYDAAGTRSNKAGPHGETTYVNRWFTLRNGAVVSKHVFAGGVRVATRVSPDPEPPSEKVYFYQADHLGSAQFVTDETALVFQHLEYFPSGETWVDERSETQRTPYLFSGKELDEETGLSYFGHRYYDPRQGQWISADPILDEMLAGPGSAGASRAAFHLSGQLTAYVGNDPLNQIDPDGLAKQKVKLSKLPPPRTITNPQKLLKYQQKLAAMVAAFGDKDVEFDDPATGRRQLDLENYAYEENGQQAIVSLGTFGKGTTRAQHFGHADRTFAARTGRPFDRTAKMKGGWKTADKGTWHHHPWRKTIAFVPRQIHKYLGHSATFKARYG